ncbi:DNA polymerase epsilon subunit 2 [Borealophlyctis nickersoniae]|nr:DNA polymerase epsilon subunit 2 [Borealophlyctis nickersoniae]
MAPPASQVIFRILTKKHGLTLKTDASKYLEERYLDIATHLDAIAQAYLQHQGTRPAAHMSSRTLTLVLALCTDNDNRMVDRASLEPIVESLLKRGTAVQSYAAAGSLANMDIDGEEEENARAGRRRVDVADYMRVIDAFTVPKWRYRSVEKTFVSVEDKAHLLAPAAARNALFRDRFDLIRQRILRNDAFRAPGFAQEGDYFEITPIKNLHGRKSGKKWLLFGMLTQMEEGKYHLEDLDDCIEIDWNSKASDPLSPTPLFCYKRVEKGTGLFTLNTFVLAEGIYTENKTFHVVTLGMPLPEPREKSLTAFGSNVNFFGGPREVDDLGLIQQIELDMVDASMVIVSDVWLDQPRVLMKLRELFEGFSQTIPPLAFIFLGNFISSPYIHDGTDHRKYKDSFNSLADLLADFPVLSQNCHFIFVPGPHDPWASTILPRPRIPDFFTARLRAKAPKAVFMSNPCRIKYCTQEIVVFREDLVNKMRRNCIVPPNDDGEVPIEKHLVATVLDQAHLSPLPLSVRPVYWAHDHALRLYPHPHVLILADRYDSYSIEYEGCICLNPGSFANTDFTFMVYQPATRTCQESKV